MSSYLRRLISNVSNTPLAHAASMTVLIVSIIFETTKSIHVGQDAAFIAFIPAIVVIVYLEGRLAAIAATFLMAAAGLWARFSLNTQISTEDWTRAVLLLVSGGVIALTFHRLRQDLRHALDVAEARLVSVEATESRYRWAFDRAAMGFANTNEKGELLQSNRRLCEMTGYKQDELAQLRLSNLVHPNDRAALLKLAAGADVGGSLGAELRLSRKDGTTFWARVTPSSSRPDDAISERMFVVVDDISDRRTAREALRAQKEWLDLALSAGRLGTWRIDLKDMTVTGSGKFWEILGLPPASSRPLEDLSSVVHPADWPKLAASIKPASTTNYDAEIRVRRVDGHIHWMALRGREENDDDGRPLRIGVAADLTERRQTTLLRAAVKKRERLMLEQRHRFSNLFPVIIALVKMVNISENDVARYKEVLIDRIRALESTHLLLSRRTSASGMLHDLVDQELQLYRESRDIEISGPSIMMSDGAAESFAMVLHELATNSVKYGALGDLRGRIEVRWAFASEGAGSDIVFDWAETGERKASHVVRHGFGSMIIGVDGTPIVGHSPKLEISARGLRYSLRLSRREVES